MNTVEEYAIWLAETGVGDSAQNDLNEGCDPISERGEEVSDSDWRAAMKLAHEIADWIRENPETLLEQVRGEAPDTESLLSLIGDLTDDGDCRFDHHGGCQEHGYLSLEPGEKCPQQEAKELLAAAKSSETAA